MENTNQQQQQNEKAKLLKLIRSYSGIVESHADKISMMSNSIIHNNSDTSLTEDQLKEISDGLKNIYDLIQPLRYTLESGCLLGTDNPVYIMEADDEPERWEK